MLVWPNTYSAACTRQSVGMGLLELARTCSYLSDLVIDSGYLVSTPSFGERWRFSVVLQSLDRTVNPEGGRKLTGFNAPILRLLHAIGIWCWTEVTDLIFVILRMMNETESGKSFEKMGQIQTKTNHM